MTLTFSNPKSRIPQWECLDQQRWLVSAPTGWGKTVWLKQLALLQDAETTRLVWNGNPVTPENASLYRSAWLYVPQTPFRPIQNVTDHFSNILQLKVHRGKDILNLRRQFSLALKKLGKEPLLTRSMQHLSGGEAQIIAIVRSVLLAPEGLFLDEPTSGMDRVLTESVEDWIMSHFSGAWVWITHDQQQVARLHTKTPCHLMQL